MDAQMKKELTKACTNEQVQKQTHKRAMLKIKATEKERLERLEMIEWNTWRTVSRHERVSKNKRLLLNNGRKKEQKFSRMI